MLGLMVNYLGYNLWKERSVHEDNEKPADDTSIERKMKQKQLLGETRAAVVGSAPGRNGSLGHPDPRAPIRPRLSQRQDPPSVYRPRPYKPGESDLQTRPGSLRGSVLGPENAWYFRRFNPCSSRVDSSRVQFRSWASRSFFSFFSSLLIFSFFLSSGYSRPL